MTKFVQLKSYRILPQCQVSHTQYTFLKSSYIVECIVIHWHSIHAYIYTIMIKPGFILLIIYKMKVYMHDTVYWHEASLHIKLISNYLGIQTMSLFERKWQTGVLGLTLSTLKTKWFWCQANVSMWQTAMALAIITFYVTSFHHSLPSIF